MIYVFITENRDGFDWMHPDKQVEIIQKSIEDYNPDKDLVFKTLSPFAFECITLLCEYKELLDDLEVKIDDEVIEDYSLVYNYIIGNTYDLFDNIKLDIEFGNFY